MLIELKRLNKTHLRDTHTYTTKNNVNKGDLHLSAVSVELLTFYFQSGIRALREWHFALKHHCRSLQNLKKY